MSHLLDKLNFFQSKELEQFSDGWGRTTRESRYWEDTYRNRWRHDKVVRSTHGVNCTGSCSWKIYVKSGIVTWETQETDYPRTRAGLPNHEPRGCARGASYSWYLFSGNQEKNPLIQGALMRAWRKMRATMTPLAASAAIQNDPALPLPDSLRGGAAAKVVSAMLAKGFLEEVDAEMRNGEPVWRETGDGHGVTLIATDAGLAAIGIETGSAEVKPTNDAAPKTCTPREGTKQATLIAMLRAPDGATIAEIMAATGWQSHTVRGAMSGALKKKLGLEVTSEKVEDRGRVYKLPVA